MLQLVSLLTFFLADIVKLGEKLEIGKCLPRGGKDIYADIARFKGLIKGRKSWDDDPCNFSPILAIRDEFSLPVYARTLSKMIVIQICWFTLILNLCPSQKRREISIGNL